ncbi:MAG: hypothetical protein ACI3XI_08245 [Eubacteriales bacterium]
MSEKRYFAASNTECGFVSYFAENFRNRADRCYIIKGGPGTGKSRLMREMGGAAESAGGKVEYYYCSSDPDSLDGLFITVGSGTVAVLDGTAPHAEEVGSPGTVDNILDVGRFWDTKLLRERASEIAQFGRQKSNAYACAYRALAAYGNLTRNADDLVEACTDVDTIAEETAKIAMSLPSGKSLRSPLSAVGMKGRVTFETFREDAKLSLSVTDGRRYGVSYLYFEHLRRAVGGCRVSPHPIMSGRFDGLLAGGVAVCESIFESGEKAIDIGEFVDRSSFLKVKDRVDGLRKLAEGALAEADVFFREAGAAHMKIEEIFTSAMDFAAKEEYSSELCKKISHGDL